MLVEAVAAGTTLGVMLRRPGPIGSLKQDFSEVGLVAEIDDRAVPPQLERIA